MDENIFGSSDAVLSKRSLVAILAISLVTVGIIGVSTAFGEDAPPEERLSIAWEDLIARWNFNNPDGTVEDVSINSYNGSIEEEPACVSSPISLTGQEDSKTLDFDGSNDYVDTITDDPFDLTAPISVGGWIWISNDHPELSSEEWNLFGKYDGSNGWIFRYWRGGLQLWINGNLNTSANFAPSREEWHHWMATYDGTEVKYYRDGSLWDTVPCQAGFPDSTVTLKLAQRGDDAYYAEGRIDEPRIYNRALTEDEIESIYNRTRPK